MPHSNSLPMKLSWLEAVRAQLVEERCEYQPSVMSLAQYLIEKGDRDGTHIYPTQESMMRESGVRSWHPLRRNLDWLLDRGFLVHVKKLAKGQDAYRATVPTEVSSALSEDLTSSALSEDLTSSALSEDLISDSRLDPRFRSAQGANNHRYHRY